MVADHDDDDSHNNIADVNSRKTSIRSHGIDDGNKILIRYQWTAGHYCKYNSIAIGEYYVNLIPIAIKKELIQECKKLIQNKDKLNYRDSKLTSNKTKINI